jgi:hypothetical protein
MRPDVNEKLSSLRDALLDRGVTATSPADLGPEGERLARQERQN